MATEKKAPTGWPEATGLLISAKGLRMQALNIEAPTGYREAVTGL